MSLLTFMVAPPIGADNPPTTRVTRQVLGRRAVLTVYGEIDAYSVPALGHAVDMVIAGARRL
jgi:hypothetical protein